MSFFKDFKEDLSQAVNELLPETEETIKLPKEEEKEAEAPSLEAMMEEMFNHENILAEASGRGQQSEAEAEPDAFANVFADAFAAETSEHTEEPKSALTEEAEQLEIALEEENRQQETEWPDAFALEEELQPELPVEEALQEEKPVTEEAEQTTGEMDISSMLHDLLEEEAPAAEIPANVIEDIDLENTEIGEKTEMEMDGIMGITEEMVPEAAEETMQDTVEIEAMPALEDEKEAADEVTTISRGVRLEGNLNADGSVEMLGYVKGDVTCLGKLMVSGTIEGNPTAAEIYANSARIEGNIKSNGNVKIGNGSVIIGDITAASVVIGGAVKGNIDVNGPVIIDSTAIVVGDIKSRSIQLNNGAVLEGHVSQCYSGVDVDALFASKDAEKPAKKGKK